MIITYSRVCFNRVRLPQSCSWSAEKGKLVFPCPRLRLRIWSRVTVWDVPSRVSLLILHTHAKSGAYSRDYSRFPRRRLLIYITIGPVPSLWVTQLRTDGVHCQESTTAGPEALEVVPVTDAAFTVITMDHIMCASFCAHPLFDMMWAC